MGDKFTKDRISDQKRLARGEHLLMARSFLRARDAAHNARWDVMIMAGMAPAGEIAAIRELMPKARIVSVDKSAECLDAAIVAGTDDVVHKDLVWWARQGEGGLGGFDLIDLDLCSNVNDDTRAVIKACRHQLVQGGVLMATFSYGRDVSEMFAQTLSDWRHAVKKSDSEAQRATRVMILDRMAKAGVPDRIAGRLCYLFSPSMLERVHSVILYRGNESPMCSVLYTASRVAYKLSFVQLGAGDFELAVVYPSAANLYDCPQDRIESLRRKFAAIKASITRRAEADVEVEEGVSL